MEGTQDARLDVDDHLDEGIEQGPVPESDGLDRGDYVPYSRSMRCPSRIPMTTSGVPDSASRGVGRRNDVVGVR